MHNILMTYNTLPMWFRIITFPSPTACCLSSGQFHSSSLHPSGSPCQQSHHPLCCWNPNSILSNNLSSVLPIKYMSKICFMVYKFLHDWLPIYLSYYMHSFTFFSFNIYWTPLMHLNSVLSVVVTAVIKTDKILFKLLTLTHCAVTINLHIILLAPFRLPFPMS